MRELSLVSIIGRPNVGKSSLCNRIVHRKVAVVDDRIGVTRDRHYIEAAWNGTPFKLVDTGGLMPQSKEPIPRAIHKQVDIALQESAVIVVVTELGNGPSEVDLQIARMLRKQNDKPVILVVNKSESRIAELEAGPFIKLGLGEPHFVSAIHGKGVGDLLDEIVRQVLKMSHGRKGRETVLLDAIQIAVVGRPNSGKSSIVNRLLGKERMIVDSVAGTTRDSIDSQFVHEGRNYTIVDTAGLRQKSHVHDDLEYYCNRRAIESIGHCQIVVLVIDAQLGLGEQDLKILKQIILHKRGAVIALNKWDLVAKTHQTFDHTVAEIRALYTETRNLPFISISALSGQRVVGLLELISAIQERMRVQIPPREIREFAEQLVSVHPHPMVGTKVVKVFGGKQKAADFPLFHFFTTHPPLVTMAYKRYLLNSILEKYDFEGCPVEIGFKSAGLHR